MNIKTFVIDKKLNYQELKVKDLAINKFYELENPGVSFKTIPDACVDLQFTMEEGKCIPYACGSFLESEESPTGKYTHCFGVKFNPGMVPLCMRKDISNLVGSRRTLEDVDWLVALGQKIAAANSFEERVVIFKTEFLYDSEICEENRFVDYAMKRIQEENGCINIAQLALEMGYNQKYMDRVFRQTTGMTMKKYAIIIRIQKAITYLQQNRIDEVYEKLGYYDQSHFIKDFKRFTNMTPNQYCKKNKYTIV